jgi:hypothetical protein
MCLPGNMALRCLVLIQFPWLVEDVRQSLEKQVKVKSSIVRPVSSGNCERPQLEKVKLLCVPSPFLTPLQKSRQQSPNKSRKSLIVRPNSSQTSNQPTNQPANRVLRTKQQQQQTPEPRKANPPFHTSPPLIKHSRSK